MKVFVVIALCALALAEAGILESLVRQKRQLAINPAKSASSTDGSSKTPDKKAAKTKHDSPFGLPPMNPNGMPPRRGMMPPGFNPMLARGNGMSSPFGNQMVGQQMPNGPMDQSQHGMPPMMQGNFGQQMQRPGGIPQGNFGQQMQHPGGFPQGNLGQQMQRPGGFPQGNFGQQMQHPGGFPQGNFGQQMQRPGGFPQGMRPPMQGPFGMPSQNSKSDKTQSKGKLPQMPGQFPQNMSPNMMQQHPGSFSQGMSPMQQGRPQWQQQGMSPMQQGMPPMQQGRPQWQQQGMSPMQQGMPSVQQGRPQWQHQGMPPMQQGMSSVQQGRPQWQHQGMPPMQQGMPPMQQGRPQWQHQGMPPMQQGRPQWQQQGMPPMQHGFPPMRQGMPHKIIGMPPKTTKDEKTPGKKGDWFKKPMKTGSNGMPLPSNAMPPMSAQTGMPGQQMPGQQMPGQQMPGQPMGYPMGPQMRSPMGMNGQNANTLDKFMTFEHDIEDLRSNILKSFYKDLMQYKVLSDVYRRKMMAKLALLNQLEAKVAMPVRNTIAYTTTSTESLGPRLNNQAQEMYPNMQQ